SKTPSAASTLTIKVDPIVTVIDEQAVGAVEPRADRPQIIPRHHVRLLDLRSRDLITLHSEHRAQFRPAVPAWARRTKSCFRPSFRGSHTALTARPSPSTCTAYMTSAAVVPNGRPSGVDLLYRLGSR